MLYTIQLIFKILFHPCEGGIPYLLAYVTKGPQLTLRKDAERQDEGDPQHPSLADLITGAISTSKIHLHQPRGAERPKDRQKAQLRT